MCSATIWSRRERVAPRNGSDLKRIRVHDLARPARAIDPHRDAFAFDDVDDAPDARDGFARVTAKPADGTPGRERARGREKPVEPLHLVLEPQTFPFLEPAISDQPIRGVEQARRDVRLDADFVRGNCEADERHGV